MLEHAKNGCMPVDVIERWHILHGAVRPDILHQQIVRGRVRERALELQSGLLQGAERAVLPLVIAVSAS